MSFFFKKKKKKSHEKVTHATFKPPLDAKEDPETTRFREHLQQKDNTGKLKKSQFKLGATLGTGTFGRVRLVRYVEDNVCTQSESSQDCEAKPKSQDCEAKPKSQDCEAKPKSPSHSSSDSTVANGQVPGRIDEEQNWILAFKMLKKTEIIRLKQVAHIKSEKQILSKITHPFIVNLYGTFQDEQCIYMVMEYIIGGELFSQLRRAGRFSNDASRFFAAEIVLALEYLHTQDIVYRDLKPENLLIDKSGHIKITDFGFAKKVDDRTWTLCGTPEYLAPEIIQSKGHGKAVDWWALGILIYEMLAGYPPFYDENPFGIYQKILAGKIEFPRHFDSHAKDLVRKLLTPDRSKRIGCLKDGAEDVKLHRWFRHVDWEKVYNKQTRPPIVPGFKSEDDTRNFDDYPSSDEEEGPPLRRKDAKQFEDF